MGVVRYRPHSATLPLVPSSLGGIQSPGSGALHVDRAAFSRSRVNRWPANGIIKQARSETVATRDDPGQPDFAELTARVYRLCRALLGDETQARDAAQEALARAWSRRARRRSEVSWWTWAAGFAVRVCREATRRPTPVLPMGNRATNDLRAAAREVDADPDRLAAVQRAVTQLPDRQREVLVLRLLIGQSTQEAARTLNVPAGTIKSNLHKAIQNLRSTIAQAETTDEVRRM